LLLAVDIHSACDAEIDLIEPLVDEALTKCVPPRLNYDRAVDAVAHEVLVPLSKKYSWPKVSFDCLENKLLSSY
jgi:hypothetical protein